MCITERTGPHVDEEQSQNKARLDKALAQCPFLSLGKTPDSAEKPWLRAITTVRTG